MQDSQLFHPTLKFSGLHFIDHQFQQKLLLFFAYVKIFSLFFYLFAKKYPHIKFS